MTTGNEMYEWARELFPVCRSITGPGVRETLTFIQKILPDLQIKSVPSGTPVFDWVVPDEWEINEAYIEDESGKVLVDFKVNNLHVVGYSSPVNKWMTLEELDAHLYSLENRPNAIPYVTSYYKRDWGFCVAHTQRKAFKPGRYKVLIDSKFKKGVLNYAELIVPGSEKKEIFFSTYICHPSMANNELSGPVVAAAIAKWVSTQADRRFTYRFVFIPETIGSISYLSMHHTQLKSNVIAGFNLTCVGDDRAYSFMPSLQGNTLADQVSLYALKAREINFKQYTFLERGSDERQYCWPGIDLPLVSIMRSKYGVYPEYHSSDDDLSVISPLGLQGAFDIHVDCIKTLEANKTYRSTTMGEPNLGKRGLYASTSVINYKKPFSRDLIDLLIYCDGNRNLVDVASILNKPIDYIQSLVDVLLSHQLLELVNM